jgi:hypothetical protein
MAETQMVEALRNSVIEGGSSTGGNGSDFLFEIVCAVGERLSAEYLEPHIVVEIDDEHLVLRIAGMSECKNGSGNFGELWTHAAAVVDDQAHGHRSVFLLKESDLLEAAILEDAEVLQSQSGDEVSI